MKNQVKLEFQDGATLRKRWLEEGELQAWGDSLGSNAVVTITREGREVIISTADLRTPPGSHMVAYQEGVTQYWQDCGESLPEALAFAGKVFAEGIAAFQE